MQMAGQWQCKRVVKWNAIRQAQLTAFDVVAVRVINRIHADRCSAMVFGDCHRPAKAHFKPGTGAVTAAEEVHDDLIVLLVEATWEVLLPLSNRRYLQPQSRGLGGLRSGVAFHACCSELSSYPWIKSLGAAG